MRRQHDTHGAGLVGGHGRHVVARLAGRGHGSVD